MLSEVIMEYLKDRMNKLFATSLISSIVMLVLGILLLVKPDFIINIVSTIIGLAILVPGIVSLVDYFKTKYNANLVIGVIACIIGIIFIFNSKFVSSILPFVLGIYFIINGISKLQYGIELRKNQVVNYMASIITSILMLVCGVLLIINPFGGALAITQVLGIFMLVYAILDIYNAIMIRKEVKETVKVIKENVR